MANDVQNSLFTAIDTIVGRRIEELELDKTVIASVEQCTNTLERQYRVQYKGGSMVAYAQSDESYTPNTSVYVSIPQNDFSQKKWILGRVSEVLGDYAVTEVGAAIADYQLIGDNVISVANKDQTEFGLCSYYMENNKQVDAILLYDRNSSNNLLNIDQDKLKTYMTEAEAVLLEASFRTNLNRQQQNRPEAEYGLAFTLVFESADGAYATNKEKFEALAANIKLSSQEKEITLVDLDKQVKAIIDKEDTDVLDDLTLIRSIILTGEGAYKDKTEMEDEYGLLTQYATLLDQIISDLEQELTATWTSHYGIWFAASPKTLLPKEVTYSLYSDKMIGNPFSFWKYTEQYDIFNIDTARFKYIDQVLFYCRDFYGDLNVTSETKLEYLDIFVKDIEFYGLKELTAVNGDYKLKMKFPQGQVFEVSEETMVLSADADLYYKTDVLNTGTEYYWFIKDGRVVDAGHANYHIRGGVGWRYFEKTTSEDKLTLSSVQNTAYENIYKCVVVYQGTIVLKTEFTIYNNNNKREIVIESDLGKSFKFDNGSPILTCKILDGDIEGNTPISIPSEYNGYTYSYTWMRRDQSDNVVAFDKTYEELKAEYEDSASDFATKLLLKSKLAEMENIIINKNVLQYPVCQIKSNEYVTFECYVYKKKNKEGSQEQYLGVGSITLRNDLTASIPEYHIVIENGDQVFQYSESGVSPCNDRVQDPVKTRNLICHFYDPNGLEVNKDLYNVTWQYPLSNSLLIPPTEGLVENPSNGLIQFYKEETAPVEIVESYDYAALDNQITCIVEYASIKIAKETEFYFGKIGDNGTNGTDLVAKIEPIDTYGRIDNEPLTLISVAGSSYSWNTGIPANNPVLELRVYNRNEMIDNNTYKHLKWKVAGGTFSSKYFFAEIDEDQNCLCAVVPGANGERSNMLVRGQADVSVGVDEIINEDGTVATDPNTGEVLYENTDWQTVYAFYPVCMIDYTSMDYKTDLSIKIDKDRTLKQILYNADGRNPMYNQNQGVFFDFSDDPGDYHVSWTAKGGSDTNEMLPAFDLSYNETIAQTFDDCPYVYIKPKDVYGGQYQNNHVEAKVYHGDNHIATVYVPIYIALNRYGLASLNAWDGNTIEINEDENYIMAPQIGAGVKEDDADNGYSNVFTGVVMGKATTYDGEEQVGLLGYSKGRQSIFLDAKTGNATFGLPEIDERDSNQLNLSEGRIELRPGGLSSIANWKINSRMLFNVPDANKNNSEEYNTWGGLGEPYADLQKLSDEYIKSIPHDKSGVLISSDPSYISIKGKPLKTEEDIDFTLANTIVKPDDTFELQLNPNDSSIFTIYRHTRTTQDPDMGIKINKDDGHFYVGKIFIAENENDAEEDFTEYSVSIPLDATTEKEIIGWQAIKPDPIDEHYLIPCKYSQTKINENGEQEEKTVWAIRAVPEPGDYLLSLFDSEETDPSVWRREKRVGINEQGRFYTNALRSSSSALNIDNVGAFGFSADTGKYVGASFEVGSTEDKSKSLIKMFTSAGTNNLNLDEPDGTLYISGSSEINNEYIRPTRLYGNSVTLLADNRSNNTYYAKNRVRIDGQCAFIGSSTKAIDFSEEKNPQFGNFLFFSSEDSNSLKQTRFRSMYSVDSVIGKITELKDEEGNLTGEYNWPLLLKDDGVELPNTKNDSVNQTTKINDGSLINKVYNYAPEGGHILNYATGSLQLNKAAQDDDNKAIIDKALQINDNDILLGNIDTFETSLKSDWNTASLGTVDLCSDITIGKSMLEMSADRSIFVSQPRIGIYGQNDIEIQAVHKKSGSSGIVRIKADHETDSSSAYLELTPGYGETTTSGVGDFKLYSQYGSLYSRSDIVDASYYKSSDKGIRNGLYTNYSLKTAGVLLVTGTVGGSHDDYKDMSLIVGGAARFGGRVKMLDNASVAGTLYSNAYCFDAIKTGSTTEGGTEGYESSDIWNHINNLYQLVKKAQSRADSAYSEAESAANSLPNHRHSFTQLTAVTGVDWTSVDVRNAAGTASTTVGSVSKVTTGGGGTVYTSYTSA